MSVFDGSIYRIRAQWDNEPGWEGPYTAKLYTDRGTDEDMANQELQKKLANTIALPVYVLLKPDGTTVINKYEGLAPSPEEFVKFLDGARSSS